METSLAFSITGPSFDLKSGIPPSKRQRSSSVEILVRGRGPGMRLYMQPHNCMQCKYIFIILSQTSAQLTQYSIVYCQSFIRPFSGPELSRDDFPRVTTFRAYRRAPHGQTTRSGLLRQCGGTEGKRAGVCGQAATRCALGSGQRRRGEHRAQIPCRVSGNTTL